MALKPKRSEPKAGAEAEPGAEAERATALAASRLVEEKIRSLGGWRAETLAEIRRLIHEADPDIVEECKWIKPSNPQGVPVWSHAGIVFSGEAYKQVVKLTFARGASLDDPRGLFNSSLDGNKRRAIDIREGEMLDAEAFSFEQSADDTAALLEYLHIEKADLFGFSNGGTIALQVAIRHPRVVRKLVVASGFFRRDGCYPWLWDSLAQAQLKDMPKALQEEYRAVSSAGSASHSSSL